MAETIGTALVTGASSGIGRELARIHAGKGGDLVLVARRVDRLKELKTELEGTHSVTVTVLAEDLGDEGAPERIHTRVADAGIEVAYLINNAGFGGRGRFDARDWATDRAMIQVNVVALTALTRAFVPDLVARGSGRILNVSSTAALVPGPLQAVYYATKAYVSSFSYALAEELRDTGVTVTALMPGATETEFAKTADMDRTSMFKAAFSARKVAEDGYAAMMKGALDAMSGVTFGQRLVLRIAPLLPKRLILRTIRRSQTV